MCTLLALALINFNSSAYILAASCTNMQLHAKAGALPFQLETEMEAPFAKLVLREEKKKNSKYLALLSLMPCSREKWNRGNESRSFISTPARGFWAPDGVTEWREQQMAQFGRVWQHYGMAGRQRGAEACRPLGWGCHGDRGFWGEFRLSRLSHVTDFTAKKLWINSAYAEQNIN